ncbi:MAG: putative addiction module antidote protein [Actinomycetaceae bacterium]|nr:putative addiction module antidote protein [Actinomycetaceae bacterium]
MATEVFDYDISEDIETKEDALMFLKAACEEAPGDVEALQDALGLIGRGLGMTALAKELGVSRSSLYRSLSKDGNPSLKTISDVIELLGGHIAISLNEENKHRVPEEELVAA